MSPAGQLAFDLGHRPALGREDFMVGPANADAVAWVDCWPDWPGPALVVHGPPGCGKTHLASVWRARTGAEMIATAKALQSVLEAPSPGACFVIEDKAVSDDGAGLFHLFNRLADNGGHMLLIARDPPARWRGRLPDLISRLTSAPTAAISAPDDAMIGAVLAKLFADRQLRVAPEVIAYLVSRMERSFDAARRAVAAADRASLVRARPITVPLMREILGQPAP
jgi:chromosomal replication initiation ATPase DnaA